MNTEDLERLRYPLGRYVALGSYQASIVQNSMERIALLPQRLTSVVSGSTPAQWKNRYRPEGWTATQVIHHLSESHLNGLVRFKLALTEETPAQKPYSADRWVQLVDGTEAPVEIALDLIRALHAKWGFLMRSLSPGQWQRAYFHTEQKKNIPLFDLARMYAWHGEHHLRHLEIALRA